MKLSGISAFSALSEVLSGNRSPDSFSIEDITPERFREAMIGNCASSLDLAVLLRQVLLGEKLRRKNIESPRLPTPNFLTDFTGKVGLEIINNRVRALPWCPSWLPDADNDLGCQAAFPAIRRFGPDDLGPVADPFLEQLGHSNYRSVAQRAAIRSSLLAPPGSTTTVILPTGEGKSKIFQAVDEIGFASDRENNWRSGVTLVVVPTVALAYDHERSFQKKIKEPLAYVGSSKAEIRKHVRARIEKENRGLVFVAPEAAIRSLRPALLSTARVGRLKAIVVDEAHLIDAWGTGFRSEFQSLSRLRRELIAESPSDCAPRTLLLSATLTAETLETLNYLFTEPGELMKTLSAGQLRPEPDYWVASPSPNETRIKRVIEALCHLPRPAILYVSKPKEAEDWKNRLREFGFKRLASFHGKTPDSNRRSILTRWQGGSLDLVVATSAFGLGIDYRNVRTVIHACVPETLDRFYQEVGRGGRDGCASISIAIPAFHDFDTAKALNQETVLTIERGLKRWKAMFEHKDSTHLHGTTFCLRVDIAPSQSIGDIDLRSKKNIEWNVRLLSLLSRAQIIRRVGTQDKVNELSQFGDEDKIQHSSTGEYEIVEVLETAHLDEKVWQERVEPVRESIWKSRSQNLELMHKHLSGESCPSKLLLELYGQHSLDPICTECALCRQDSKNKSPKILRREPFPCWDAPPLIGEITKWMRTGTDVVIMYDPNEVNPALPRRWLKAFNVFWQSGFRSLALLGNLPTIFDRAIENLREKPIFVSSVDNEQSWRLPTGPRVIIVGPAHSVHLLQQAKNTPQRLAIISKDMPDIGRPGQLALERFSGPVFNLGYFLERFGNV